MPTQEPLHALRAAQGHAPSLRGRPEPHEPTRDPGSDEAAAIHRRASLRHTEIPHLRPSPHAAARSRRSPYRNRSRSHGLQPQTHDQPARAKPTEANPYHSLTFTRPTPPTNNRNPSNDAGSCTGFRNSL